ncbi:MAG: CAP domain-containing protein [Desulfotomaculaceae bacterium]|nr:CAP domain-containing protein [Desulfotomaculaceae bacterium]
MSRIRRVLYVFVTCLLMFSLTLTTASAAVNPYPANSPMHMYWNKYYGDSGTKPVTPATPATPTTPLGSYWSNYYGSKYGRYTAKPTTPETPAKPATPMIPTTPTTGQGASILSTEEKLMLDLVNRERAKAGLQAFNVNAKLVELARMKSQDMYQNNYFSHTSPTYGCALDMEKKAGISARVMGAENIAKAATTQRANELFMNSEGHRANIMNSIHTTIGIGIVKTPNGVVVTQLFTGN